MEHLAQMDESEQDEFMREASRNKKSVQTCLPRLKYTEYVCPHTLDARIIHHHLIPAPSKGWCLNPKGLFSGTPYHPLGTPWRVQVYIHIYLEPNCWVLGVYIYMYDVHVFFHPTHHIPSPLKKKTFRTRQFNGSDNNSGSISNLQTETADLCVNQTKGKPQ